MGDTWQVISTLIIPLDAGIIAPVERLSAPWWTSIWFRPGIALLLLSLFFLFYKVRTRFLKNQKKKLEDLVILRTKELEKSNEELRHKNHEIQLRTEEIQTLLEEVAGQKNDIENKNAELHEINSELQLQRDSLESKGNELEKAQISLKEINANLEILVTKRTQKLNHAIRELETFLYHSSHDLRGPISSMLGLMELSKLEKSKQDTSYTDFFQITILKLERTLQRLMQRHLIQRSKLSPEAIDKASFICLLNDNLKEIPSFRQEDLALSLDVDLSFSTDKLMLSIIITNLLENAFFFSERAQNKKVTLTVRSSGEKTVIVVEDNGAGIKDDIRKKIFTMFYRGNELSSGNGLGLYLIQCALHKIEGSIELETEEGSFARFIVTL